MNRPWAAAAKRAGALAWMLGALALGAVFAAAVLWSVREEGRRLEAALARAEAEIAELERARRALAAERERLAARLAEERRRREELARALVGEREELVRALAEARVRIRERQEELAGLRAETARLQEESRALRRALARAESGLEVLRSSAEATRAWLERWVAAQVARVVGLLDRVGVDAGALLARAERGVGGPFEPLARFDDPLFADTALRLRAKLNRLEALERLLTRLPLAAPLDRYVLTSGFGPRRDPLVKKSALHRGVDLAAPHGSRVLAPAGGLVLRAERNGPFGLFVEIDHGMGIVTRYGHLSRILVRAGERVEAGALIGLVGSTGRSTGPHLHYEVRIDDQPLDPSRFFEAGRELVRLLGQDP